MLTGIFGGSFNPIHNGHIHLAESVRNEFGLDKIIFVPSKTAPHKSSESYISEEHRLNMLKLAVQDRKGFSVSTYELECDRISYSIYTVNHFKEIYPDDELFLLVGGDMFMSFDKWYKFEEIMSKVTLIVTSRETGTMPQLIQKSEQLSAYGKTIICQAPPFPVSSTEIRKKIMKNQNYTCYLDKNVVQYITLNNLYR